MCNLFQESAFTFKKILLDFPAIPTKHLSSSVCDLWTECRDTMERHPLYPVYTGLISVSRGPHGLIKDSDDGPIASNLHSGISTQKSSPSTSPPTTTSTAAPIPSGAVALSQSFTNGFRVFLDLKLGKAFEVVSPVFIDVPVRGDDGPGVCTVNRSMHAVLCTQRVPESWVKGCALAVNTQDPTKDSEPECADSNVAEDSSLNERQDRTTDYTHGQYVREARLVPVPIDTPVEAHNPALSLVVPMKTTDSLAIAEIDKIRTKLSGRLVNLNLLFDDANGGFEKSDGDAQLEFTFDLIMAIIAEDSTIVYYSSRGMSSNM